MVRTLLVQLCGLLLRLFFRRIEIVGAHHLPADGATVLTFNHPSGLIDPLFALCLSGKRVSFLAKEPLFRMPFVGLFVRAFESLPVYRSQDGGDPANNRKMMQAAADLLKGGNALALFPEGTSHSEPTLLRFRSGAARIALSARALSGQPVYVVPGALYYETKQTFRSRAVVSFGEPIEVPTVELDHNGETPREAGHELTSRLQRSMHGIMPTADTVEDLVLAEHAERVLVRAGQESPELCPSLSLIDESFRKDSAPTLSDRMRTRRRIIDGYMRLFESRPEQIRALIERLRNLQEELEAHGLPVDAPALTPANWKKKRVAQFLLAVSLFPLALLGIIVHLPTYSLIRYVAFRVAGKEADITATVKLIAGMLFFPLTWLLGAGIFAWLQSNLALLSLAGLGPLLGWSAMRFLDATAALLRSISLTQRARRAPFAWGALSQQRATLAEDMAQLLTSDAETRLQG